MSSEPLSSRFGRSFPAGQVLFREGEPGVEMFVIQTGRVRISKVFPSGERTLAVIGPGEFFGEMAILNNKPRTATATALEALHALVIDGRTFEAMVLGNGEIAVRMITRLARRLHSANAYIDILSRADPRARVILGLARAGEDDLLASMDSDHTHPPEAIPSMVAKIDAGADLVIASRYVKGAEIHGLVWWRHRLSDVASWVFRVLFPCGARDYTCGFRVYRVSLLRRGAARYGRHFLNQRGFSVMVDVLLKLRRHARRIDEVPLILRYDRKVGASKMKVAATIGTTLRLLGRRFVGDPTGP